VFALPMLGNIKQAVVANGSSNVCVNQIKVTNLSKTTEMTNLSKKNNMTNLSKKAKKKTRIG